jgi:hypothetical protein
MMMALPPEPELTQSLSKSPRYIRLSRHLAATRSFPPLPPGTQQTHAENQVQKGEHVSAERELHASVE